MRIQVYLVALLLPYYSVAQNKVDSTVQSLQQFPDKYYSNVEKKLSSIDDKLTKKSEKYLVKLEKHERKIQEKLQKLNPESATKVLDDSKQKCDQLTSAIKNKTAKISKITGGQYSAYLDTLSTSLSFLKQFNQLGDKVKNPLTSLNDLQNKFQQTEKIKQYIAEEKEQIKQLLSKYTKVPAGLKKEFEKYNKEAYYYSAQVKEYKEMLKDPDKIEKKAISLLNKLPAFQKFMKENSMLASLFRVPADYGTAQSLAGLQTRASVQNLIQQRISAGGPNAQAQIQQNLAAAHAEMDKLKDKINQLGGGGSSNVDIPDFKPNSQKTKTFLQRIEYGANFQAGKTNSFLPATEDIGLSIGYKINDKSIAGVGASYKMGLGSIQHIQITHQGLGLRSFLDYKLKKTFYASGGFEMNYNAQFKNIEQLQNFNAWQQSGLIGISKKYKIGKQKCEMKLLYDFLAYQHIPISQPFVFRLGYTLK